MYIQVSNLLIKRNYQYKDFIINFINYTSTIMKSAKIVKPKVIQDSDEQESSSLPIVATKNSKKQQVEQKKASKKPQKQESSDEEETPVVQKKQTKTIKTEAVTVKKSVIQAKKPVKPQSSSEQSSEEQKPKKVITKVKSPVQKAVVPKKKVVQSDESEEQEPKPKIKGKITQKVTSPAQKAVSPASKPLAKKPVKAPSSSQESQEQAPIKKVKSPVQKAKSPLQKAKSPVQKPQAHKKKVQSEEQSQEVKPKKVVCKKVNKKESSSQQSSEDAKPTKKVAKPAKISKKVSSSEQSSQEKPAKKVVKTKVATKKIQSQQEEQQQKPKIVPSKPVQKLQIAQSQSQENKMVDEDQEGTFEICVKGLSFQAYDSDIRDFFNSCGNITEVKLLTREDGKSKGLAFVKFSKKSSFKKALELNGSEHIGRSLTIEQSQGKKNNNFGNNGGNFGQNNRGSFNKPQGEANIQTPTLFIGGLSYNSTAESIQAFFQQAGSVSSARVVTDKETGKPRGFGYIEFYDVQTAKKAYKQLNGANLDGRQIRLDSASQRERPQGFQQREGGFGGRGAPRNQGNSTVVLTQDDKNAKKGSIGTFAGKKIAL